MSTQTQTGVTIFTTPTDLEVVATRVFDAPRQQIWDAHTRPESIQRWMLGPEGWTMPICEVDLRPGGGWRWGWRREDGTQMQMTGIYREVTPPHRLVNTESWGGEWPDTVNTVVLTEELGKTRLTATVLYPTKDARDAAMATGMNDGWSASYDRLDRELSTMS
jgi:uncharacterized protein YndB with AHSA1/START domain